MLLVMVQSQIALVEQVDFQDFHLQKRQPVFSTGFFIDGSLVVL